MFTVTFIGNLGADPEARFTQKGDQLVQARVAVNSRRRNADGEWSDHTDWIRIRVMGFQAGQLERAKKGDRVAVIGPLTIDEYVDREGKTRQSLEVWPDTLEVLSPRPRESETGVADGARPTPLRSGGTSTANAGESVGDVPF